MRALTITAFVQIVEFFFLKQISYKLVRASNIRALVSLFFCFSGVSKNKKREQKKGEKEGCVDLGYLCFFLAFSVSF
jgi:hypothetical protein